MIGGFGFGLDLFYEVSLFYNFILILLLLLLLSVIDYFF